MNRRNRTPPETQLTRVAPPLNAETFLAHLAFVADQEWLIWDATLSDGLDDD